MTLILGPLPCKACGQIVFVDRVGPQVRIMEKERRGRGAVGHICPGRK